MKIKLLGLSGSPRHGNTDIMVQEALSAAQKLKEVETDFISLADCKIEGGCTSTYHCAATPLNKFCVDYRDDVNMILDKILQADGLIVGVPIYWGGVTAQMKCVMDRSMCVEFKGFPYRNKAAGALTVGFTRNGGHEPTLTQLHRWFMMHDMLPVGIGPERGKDGISCYWGPCGLQGFPRSVKLSEDKEGSLEAVKQDLVALKDCRLLAKRVVELARVVKLGFENLPAEDLMWAPYGGSEITFHKD